MRHAGPSPVLKTDWLGLTGSIDFRCCLTEAPTLARRRRVCGWLTNDLRPALVEVGSVRFAHLETVDTLYACSSAG